MANRSLSALSPTDSNQELSLVPYAAKTLKDRMIARILEREDEGYVRWTPRGIYDQLVHAHPELYPPDPPRNVLEPFFTDEFAEELAQHRMQRFVSRLPAHMLADRVGRRILDLVVPIIFGKLAAVASGDEQSVLDMREARMLLKDALGYVASTQEEIAKKSKKSTEEITGVTTDEAMKLLAILPEDRKPVVAQALGAALLRQAQQLYGETLDVEAKEE